MKLLSSVISGAVIWLATLSATASVQVVVDRNPGELADAGFKFAKLPAPCRNDAATNARFTLVDGKADGGSGSLEKLHDGRMPASDDAPRENFFFAAGTDGGRWQVDLSRLVEIAQVNSYSWHNGGRGPQVYVLYASDGQSAGFNAEPKKGVDPASCGWVKIAAVDSRPKEGGNGGQYGVSISDPAGSLGRYRYLLFDIACTDTADKYSNTFYSEIDVLEKQGPAPEIVEQPPVPAGVKKFATADGVYHFQVDSAQAPELAEWAEKELMPVVLEWYPKLVELLPGDGYHAPTQVRLVFKKGAGKVADTVGSRVTCYSEWFGKSLKGEAKGSVIHELVHVVQQYGNARPKGGPVPGWLVEGLTDYIRWYHFEPQTHGAEISKGGLAKAKFDGSYRVTANFLNYVTEKYDKGFVPKLNAIIRSGHYTEESWKELTGHSVQELGVEWKQALARSLGVETTAAP